MHEPAHLRDEAAIRALDLADGADIEQYALLHVAPVHEPGLHARIVVEPRGDIVLGDAGGDERARDLAAADGEAEFDTCLRRFEAGTRRIGRAADDEIAVVIGEAEGGAVAPDEPPAMTERRRAVGQMGGEVWGDGAHEGNLECDAEGPNLNTVIPAKAGIHNH